MMRFRYLGAALLLALAACNWGRRPDDFAPAIGPQGARVAVRVRGEDVDRVGELFSVDTAGVTLRADRLTRIRWPRLDAMDVVAMGSAYDIRFGETVTAEKRARLAPLSRFPQGLSGDLLRSVLTALSQSTLEEVR